ncbi:MAG: hypothetical protein AAF919_10285 [Pseudomonadota bacterium]
MRIATHLAIALVLTIVTQIGGLTWLLSRCAPRWRLAVFAGLYGAASIAALWLAPLAGRVAMPCLGEAALRAPMVFCLLNRTYVTPDLAALLTDLSAEMTRHAPGTRTVMLDGGFPFIDGFPLLPHLSHDNGRQADLAFWYGDGTGALRSPLGYFAFEDGPTDCAPRWPSLRWNLAPLQPLWPDIPLNADLTRHATAWLLADPRTARIFLEPHLQARLGLDHPKLRFQGCAAARHDDHIHLDI